MFLRHLFLVASLGLPCLVQADTDFPAGLMPVELANHFAGGVISRGLPAGFPVVNLPAGIDLRVAGGMQRGNTRDVVLLTAQDVASLRSSLAAAYVAAGWVALPTGGELSYLCHDTQGYLLLMPVSSNASALRATHTPASLPLGQTCADIAAGNTVQWHSYFVSLLPQLTAPPGAQPTGTVRANFLSMSHHYTDTSSTIAIEQQNALTVADADIAGLHEAFAEELRAQGWQNDSLGLGEWSASSVWYRTAAAPENAGPDVTATELTGMLTLLHEGGDSVQVRFGLRATTNAVFVLGSSIGIRDYMNGPPLSEPALGIRGIPSGYQPR